MPVAKVKKVIDGDTIVIKDGTRIRIANLDAPEMKTLSGEAAKRRLQRILPRGTQIGISAEKAKSFGRSVRQVTVRGKPIIKLIKKK
jgi:endonuclease YncB( thermonuclease family)